MAILMIALIVLAGCEHTTKGTADAIDMGPILASMVPEHPKLPAWPKLEWSYDGGRYSVSEADVDRILDYWENLIPVYMYEVEKYVETIKAIVSAL